MLNDFQLDYEMDITWEKARKNIKLRTIKS
jgi:hypothetical protein